MVLYEGVGVGFTGCVNYMKRKMKKGESACGISGRHLLLPLITLIFTTVLVWSGQRTATLVFLERQLTTPSATDVSGLALKPKGSKEEGNSSENTPADRKQEERFNFQPTNFTSSAPYKNGSDTNAPVCNYGKGRWVADNRRPLYSGLKCKRWLSGMWACRLNGRADFSYERYRWQPENCNMPEFDRTAFLKRMQDKTIAFIGDSIGRQQFQSLMCMATGGGESSQVEDVGIEYGLVKRPGAIRPAGYAYRFTNTNTTILYYWSSSLANLEPISGTDPIEGSKVAMHLDRPPKFLRRFIDQFDVIVLNTGHHWNKGKFKANRWVMYVNGKPNEDSELSRIGNAKNFTIRSIVKWLDSQVSLSPRTVKAFFRTISPRHFVNGEWNSGGNCDNTVPMTRGSEVVQGGSSDQLVEAAVNGTGVKILDITGLSKLRDEAHISRYSTKANHGTNDCLHWCLPGVPDTWNELLTAQL